MAKLVGAALLLIVLIDCFSDRTAHCDEFRSVGFTLRDIKKCRCNSAVQYRKAKKCWKPLIPTDHMKKQALKFCLCCNISEYRTPEMKSFCNFNCYSRFPPPVL